MSNTMTPNLHSWDDVAYRQLKNYHLDNVNPPYTPVLSNIDMTRIRCSDYRTNRDVDADVEYYVSQAVERTLYDYDTWGWFWIMPWAYGSDFKAFNE